jgi:hypothetical protein
MNLPIEQLIVSGNSERRIAKLLGINRKTVARKILFLALRARRSQERFLARRFKNGIPYPVHFDEMQSFEHTKCKPLAIPLAVVETARIILGVEVGPMPANGHLAEISRKKYGPREDQRSQRLDMVLNGFRRFVGPDTVLISDSNPMYKPKIDKLFPENPYIQHLGGRGCIVGQGELKKKHFDPMFSLNHTAAMIRDNIKRLARKTWCTTKNPNRLRDILSIYVNYHNQVLVA